MGRWADGRVNERVRSLVCIVDVTMRDGGLVLNDVDGGMEREREGEEGSVR